MMAAWLARFSGSTFPASHASQPGGSTGCLGNQSAWIQGCTANSTQMPSSQ